MKNYALLGFPLSHSLSPEIHKLLFSFSQTEAEYTLAQIPPEEFAQRANELFKLDGFNITIPYKLDIIGMLDEMSVQALQFNSVNTVVCGEKNIGHNTDVFGFVSAIEQMGTSFKNKKILLLGSGGSANMIATQAVISDCEVTIAVRKTSLHKAESLKERILSLFPSAKINTCSLDDSIGAHDILVNATPVGMYPNTDACPVSEEVIANCEYIYDLIYNPLSTKLLESGEKLGKICSNGLSMLVLQAMHAHKIWYDADFSNDQIACVIAEMTKILLDKVK